MSLASKKVCRPSSWTYDGGRRPPEIRGVTAPASRRLAPHRHGQAIPQGVRFDSGILIDSRQRSETPEIERRLIRQVGDLPRISMAEPCGMEFVLIMVVLNLSRRLATHQHGRAIPQGVRVW